MKTLRIGVLALQGDFAEHARCVQALGAEATAVRLPEQLDGLSGLIIPGGESTTMLKLMDAYGFVRPLKQAARRGLPVLGTCAGLVVMSREVTGNNMRPLELMNINVCRNAFGRQVDSFETDIAVPVLGDEPYHAVFIRAPLIMSVEPPAEVLARLDDGSIVAAREGRLLVAAFHPELTGDSRWHRYFLEMAKEK